MIMLLKVQVVATGTAECLWSASMKLECTVCATAERQEELVSVQALHYAMHCSNVSVHAFSSVGQHCNL